MKKSLPKTSAAHWLSKVKKPAGSALYGVQIAYRGTRRRFPLETANKETAAEKARDIYLSLVGGGMDATLQRFKPKSVKPIPASTIGAWITAVRATAEFRPATLDNYAVCLRLIASRIANIGDLPVLDASGAQKVDGKGNPVWHSKHDYRTGGRAAWVAKVEALPLSILSESAIQRWKVDYVSQAGAAEDARKRAGNSVGSLLRCAKSLFSPKARKYASKEIILPEPLPFASIEIPKKSGSAYQSKMDAATMIAAAMKELKGEQLKIFILALCCGLRKREIDLLTWKQVDFEKGVIRIEATEHFHPKTDDSTGSVDLDSETVELLQGWKETTAGVFVVHSKRKPRHMVKSSSYRCAPHFEPLNTWLKSKGITARKPLHELRKELGAVLASGPGIFAAQSVLRHRKISTTASFYADKKGRITAGFGSLLKHPQEPTP